MRGQISPDQLLFDPEIERTARRLNRRTRRRQKLAQEKREREASTSSTLQSQHQTIEEDMAGIPNPPPPASVPCENSPRRAAQFARSGNNARQAEMKTGMLQIMYQNPFCGHDHEDSYTHLIKFYEIAGSAGVAEAEELPMYKRLFPHSLVGKAKDWYLDQPTQTMTDWNVLEEKFLDRFFPNSRKMEARTAISMFSQGGNESLNEAWERFKSMIRKCLSHGVAVEN